MLGGGKKITSILRGEGDNQLSLVAMLVLFFMLKGLVVQWSYNKVGPTLVKNWGNVEQPFQPLTFELAMVLTLLVSFLC